MAKGTIYLYFRDKESLFQELVRAMLSPMVGTIETAQIADLPARAIAETIAELFVREIFRYAPQGCDPADHHRGLRGFQISLSSITTK